MTWKIALGSAAIASLCIGSAVGWAEDTQAPAAEPAGTSAWSTEISPDPTTGITLDDRQAEVVKQVSGYFNTLKDLKGSFVQTASDNKVMKGKFFMKRPGKFRFDYNRPSRQIIISDGTYLAIQDLDLNNEDRVDLDDTPFRLLLRPDVDLVRDARIMEVQDATDQIVLALQDKSPDTPGRIRLTLAKQPSIELKEWVTTDAQGLDTRVEVTELDKSQEIDAKLFKIEPVGLMQNMQ